MMADQATSSTTSPPAKSAPGTSVPAKPKGVTMSDRAVVQLNKLLAERQTPEAGLRIAVKGGGCTGLTYALEWAEKPRERDKIFEREGARIFVDPKSYLYLIGTELNYEETLMASGFKLENPNVKAACGCGESFTV